MRIHRLIATLVIIEKKGKVKAKELARELEVSSRTIYRDIDILSEAGFPICCTTGPDGGIHFIGSYSIGFNMPTETDLLLGLIHQLPILTTTDSMSLSIEQGVQTLQEMLKSSFSENSVLSSKILIDTNTWWGQDTNKINIKPFIDSLWYLKSIQITYKKKDESISVRLVSPYGLILKHTTWYLVAYCHLTNEIRTFLCSRIQSTSTTQMNFQIPKDFQLDQHWKSSEKAFIGKKKAVEYYPVTIELPIHFSYLLEQYEIEHLLKKDGYYTVTINLFKEVYARDSILAFLGVGKITFPPAMVCYTKTILNKQLSLYDLI